MQSVDKVKEGVRAVAVVSPQNIKRIPNKPKTGDSSTAHIVMKKQQVVVKNAKQGVAGNNPITLQVDMINRNSALTPSVFGGAASAEQDQQRSNVFSEENEGT